MLQAARRADAFRLRVGEAGGVLTQWLDDRVTPEVAEVDFTRAPDPAAALERWLDEAFAYCYQLDRSSLADLYLLRTPDAVIAYVRVHHVACDAWGLRLFLADVRAEYVRLLRGDAAPVAAPSYLAVAAADSYLGSSQHQADRAYFVDALAEVQPALFTRKRPSGARPTGRHSFDLERALIEQIRDQGHSPFLLISAAVALYLARVHRTEEVVIGVPLMNRVDGTAKRAIGHFANTLPLRVEAGADQSVGAFLDNLRTRTRALLRHQRMPLGDVLRGGAPLFDTTISYLRWPSPAEIPEVTYETVAKTHAHDADALAIWVSEFDSRSDVRVDFEFARDVFDDDFPIDAAARHIEALLRALAEPANAATRPLVALDPLSPPELDALVRGRNATAASFPRAATLPGLFAAQVASAPQQIAVIEPDGTRLTFAELDVRVCAVAVALRAHGVVPDDRVAILLERGAHLLPAILGTQLAGGAYVPVDPRHPLERVRALVEDCGAKVVLLGDDQELAHKFAALTQTHVVLSVAALTGAPGSAEVGPAPAIAPVAAPTDLAYVIYTSGSTGTPKGVMVEHHSVVNRLWWMQRQYPIGPSDVLLQKTPVSFDVSVWELFWWSFTGARLALLPPGAEKDPREVLGAIERHAVTVVHFVPSMLSPMLELLERDPAGPGRAGSLRVVFCSGEALAPAQVARFHRIFAGAVRLVNLYGPTEATVDVSCFECPAEPELARVPIGKPIDNLQLYVLDQQLRPQPMGAPGELYIGGVGVARGYLNRERLTQERFLPDPFTPGGRLYRTGDVARWLADGTLEYLGRNDDQVKIRGNRVELGEVTNQLVALAAVRDAVVVARASASRGTHLVGYCVADDELDVAALRRSLAVVLPDFMIPAFFVRIAQLPQTANGKLDARRLPAPSVSGSDAPPSTATEVELAAVWAEVLGVAKVGVHDDFYGLGGDSILMLRVRAEAQQRGLSFELTELMRHPTIAELAPRVTRATELERVAPFALVSDVDRPRLAGLEDAFPTSRLSLGLLFHTSQHPESAVYRDVFRYRFELAWDEPRFRAAVASVERQFPALRSAFELVACSEPLQQVHRAVHREPLIVELGGHAEPAAVVAAHVEARRFHPYLVERPPLYQFAAFVDSSAPAVGFELVFSFHHALLDGWSVANLIVALVAAYRGEAEPASAPALATFVAEERRALASEAAARYWAELLAGAPVTKLDGFGAHEARGEHDAVRLRCDLPHALVAQVKAFAAERSLPVKSLLLAAHCLTLHALTSAGTVVTGAVTHGRPEVPGGDRMVGLFLNTIPVRSDLAGRSWVEVVAHLFDQERAGHPHRRYPLSAIQQAYGDSLRTAFNYVNLHALEPLRELRELEVWEETNFPLFVNAIVDPIGDGLYLRVDVDGRTLTAAQARLIGATFLRVLRQLCDHAEEPVDFAFLAPPLGAAAQPAPLVDVVTRFERQVELVGDRCAVALGERRWTYRELDRASRSIATRLLGAGAQRGDAIGVALRRSPEMIAAIWGILRAGLVCVPLDVSYPAHRLALIMDTARPFRVIADSAHASVAAELVLQVEALLVDAAPRPLPAPQLDELALMLFTSGSTGRPKGVELTHRMWANYTQWQLSVPSGLPGARTLQFAPLSFDMSFQEIFSTLCGGGELRLCSNEERLNPSALLHLLEQHQVQRALLPFIALQQLADASNTLELRPRALKVVVSSGEQLRITKEVRAFCAAMPGLLLENQYGPTETHQVTSCTLTGAPETFPELPPIGRPLDGVELQLLDAELRPVPVGATGGIYIGGDCLARGYHGAPELTAERFLAHPWRPGAKLYRTGDLGRVLDSGEVIWLGREDSQVKVRGFRVEPAEVELAVMRQAAQQPGLRGAAVVARERHGGDAFLAAFLTGDADRVDLEALRRSVAAEVPEHMVPAHFAWVEAFPLTPSGKRDDAALRAIPLAQPRAEAHVAPRDEHERGLAELFGELLNVARVGIRDDFFSLGGTSITAMRLVLTIEKRYQVAIPITALIETPTVEGLASRLRDRAAVSVSGFDPLVALRTEGTRPPLFLVHPLGGHVLCYLALARALPSDQPIYALQAFGSDHGSAPLASIEAMAAAYLAALRRVQPEGPYVLGGWSFGGFVVYEMARQLRAVEPDRVKHLIVLDSITMRRDSAMAASDEALMQFFYWELVWFERSQAEVEPLPPGRSVAQQLDHIVERAIAAGVLPRGTSRVVVQRLYELFRANWQALIAYRPAPSELDLTLLRADGPLPASLKPMHDLAGTLYEDPRNGWQHWTTGKLDVIEVPGDHLVLMKEPYVQAVASAIAGVIGAAPQRDGQDA